MRHASVDDYARAPRRGGGPVAVLLCEDGVLAEASARRLSALGFGAVVAAGPGAAAVDADRPGVDAFPARISAAPSRAELVNRLLGLFVGRWVLVCFNGEFPFFPYCETRTATDFADFLRSERRSTCAAYAIDLYADAMIDDAAAEPDLDDVLFDAEGWYGFDRGDGLVDVYGGLGWRFEEYAPVALSRVNRPAFIRAGNGARFGEDLWLTTADANAISCPWHANPTMAIMSFRRTRRLLSHPNFRGAIDTLVWPNSRRFEWRSDQLSALGLIEAGQWI